MTEYQEPPPEEKPEYDSLEEEMRKIEKMRRKKKKDGKQDKQD